MYKNNEWKCLRMKKIINNRFSPNTKEEKDICKLFKNLLRSSLNIY